MSAFTFPLNYTLGFAESLQRACEPVWEEPSQW